jgi:hypothetical protein
MSSASDVNGYSSYGDPARGRSPVVAAVGPSSGATVDTFQSLHSAGNFRPASYRRAGAWWLVMACLCVRR